jgi:chemotaxis protein CheX
MSAPTQTSANNNPARFEDWRLVLRDAVKEVFSMMVGTEISVPEDAEPPLVTEVTGMVGLAGELCGVFSVRCSKKCGSNIASKMLGVPPSEADSHISDAVGEICNMAAGNFKAKIDGLEDKCMLSVPTVITGGDYQLHSLAVGNRIEAPFLFEGETVWIGLEVRS